MAVRRTDKVHTAIKFKHNKWLEPYINFNTAKRAKAQNDFEKDFFKLMDNSVFGKTMQQVRNRVDIQIMYTDEKFYKHTKKQSTIERKITISIPATSKSPSRWNAWPIGHEKYNATLRDKRPLG